MKLGAYHMVRQIAEGGAATIYLAWRRCASGEKYCILKRLKRPGRRYGDEAAYVGEIENALRMFASHRNWVRLFEAWIGDGDVFFAMEYMDAGDFFRLKSRVGCVPYEMAVYAIGEAAQGLHALHEMRGKTGERLLAVHRDVSPENILFHSSGAVKVGDFGIVQTVRTPEILRGETIRGKFCYMSPEQAWGGEVDRRSDIFSLAVVLYEAVTGRRFCLSDVIEGGMKEALRGMVDGGYPVALVAVLERALDIDREKRYPTALSFKAALDECMVSLGKVETAESWRAYLLALGMISGEGLPLLSAEDFEGGMFLETAAAIGAANEKERLLLEAFEGCDELPPEKCLGVIRSVFGCDNDEKNAKVADVSNDFSDLYDSLNLPRVSMEIPQKVQDAGCLPNLPRVSMEIPQKVQDAGCLPNLPRVSMKIPQKVQDAGCLPNLPRVSMEIPQKVQDAGGLPNLPRVSMEISQNVRGVVGLSNLMHVKDKNPKPEKKDQECKETFGEVMGDSVVGVDEEERR